uniref:C-type lectin domain-containing protein n=1 Tax=Anabas testudineus TaxID=64144 RepID=A0A7N6AYQ1_ANATE
MEQPLLFSIPSSYLLRQFHYVNLKMTWTNPQQHCRAKYTDLATIRSMDEISTLNRSVLNASWRGIMGSDSNSWRWSATGATSRTGYQSWNSGEPNDKYVEYCGLMGANGFWNDYTCEDLKFCLLYR